MCIVRQVLPWRGAWAELRSDIIATFLEQIDESYMQAMCYMKYLHIKMIVHEFMGVCVALMEGFFLLWNVCKYLLFLYKLVPEN